MPEDLRPQDEFDQQDTRTDNRPDRVDERHVAGLSRRQRWLLATEDLIGRWPVGEGHTSDR